MISVIIPCFNYGHLIAETIDSVLKQTYSSIEIIVIDDGSTDNTEEVLKNHTQNDKRVNYYKYPNAGLGVARNRGLEKAIGNFIQFLDADDLVEKQKFEVQLQIFEEHPQADIVYGSVRYFTKDAFDLSDRQLTYWGPNKEWMPGISGNGKDFLIRAFKGNFSHLSSPLFKKEIIKKVGNFDNEFSVVADYHFLLRCAVANACFYYHDTPNTYSLVRWHADNMSRNMDMMRAEDKRMRISLNPLLVNLPHAFESNNNAIKSLTYQLNTSWKKQFLSGGRFDFLKKILRVMRLEKFVLKVFYN